MDTRSRFFRNALDIFSQLCKPTWLLLQYLFDKGEEYFFFLVRRFIEERLIAFFGAKSVVHEHGGVAAVIEDHIWGAAIAPLEDLAGVIPILGQCLALDSEHGDPRGGNCRGGVILGRIDVARGPADIGSKSFQRLDQDGGLDCHVQRSGDPGTLQRLLRAVFCAGRHEARHFDFSNIEFLAAPISQRDVLDDVIVGLGHDLWSFLSGRAAAAVAAIF